jgi:predicted permease
MRMHLQMATEANLAAGMSPKEARNTAQSEFGGVDQAKESYRDERGILWLENLLRDFRFAVRSLAKAPRFAVAVVATLAAGIGSATAIMSAARHVFFTPLPFPESERLYVVEDRMMPTSSNYFLSERRFRAYHEVTTSFSGLAAQRIELMNLVVDHVPFPVQTALVSEDFFAVLGVSMAQGRALAPTDYSGGDAAAVVLTHPLWVAHFNADPDLVGREILLGGVFRRVVGIAPANFRSPLGFANAEVLVPLPKGPTRGTHREMTENVDVVGRLKPGATAAQAQGELGTAKFPPSPDAASRQIQEMMDRNIVPLLVPLRLSTWSGNVRNDRLHVFWVFLGAVGFLYAIACVTAGNLMLGRTVVRRRELGVRLALGGGWFQVFRLLLIESLVLAFLGGLAGLIIAHWGCEATAHLLSTDLRWASTSLTLEPVTLLGAVAISLLTCVFIGTAPAWRIQHIDLQAALREGAGALGISRRLQKIRWLLVVLQASLAVVLLAGAGLLAKSFYRLQSVGVGFDPAGKYVVSGDLNRELKGASFASLANRVRVQLAGLPSVRSAAASNIVPLAGYSFSWAKIDNKPDAQDEMFQAMTVSPEFFEAMGIQLLAGRGLNGVRQGDPPVVVINEVMARKLFGGENPLGRRLDLKPFGKAEIIGIVQGTFESARTKDWPQGYFPLHQSSVGGSEKLTIVLQLAGDLPPGFEASVRRALYEIDPTIVANLESLATLAGDAVVVERYALRLLQVFAGVSLLLATTGLFAVLAYTVAQQRAEFGIRMVLGATPGTIFASILRRGMFLGLSGLAIGLGLTWALTRFLKTLLYETAPSDPLVLAAVVALSLGVIGVACWLPARRASMVNPIEALRAE